jgi:hypothetical protein
MNNQESNDSSFTVKNDEIISVSSSDKPPKGFGKGVNDYLNHYVTIGDAKAAAFLALNLIEIDIILKEGSLYAYFPYGWIALGLLLTSIFLASRVLFPRLPCGSSGLIFWENICEYKNPAKYEEALSTVDEKQVEKEYSNQNYYISNVLHTKMHLVRWEIRIFFVGTVFTVLSLI